MRTSKTHLSLLLTFVFLIGWYFGLWVENWAFITLSFDIQAISLLTTAVTLWVTVYVAKIIQKSVQNRNSQNQLLIQRLDGIEVFVGEIEKMTSTDGFSYKAILARFKNLQISLKRVVEEIYRLYPNIKKEQHFGEVLLMVHEIQTAATYIPRNTMNKQPQIRVENDFVYYSLDMRTEIYSRLSLLKDKLFDLQVEVNRQ